MGSAGQDLTKGSAIRNGTMDDLSQNSGRQAEFDVEITVCRTAYGGKEGKRSCKAIEKRIKEFILRFAERSCPKV